VTAANIQGDPYGNSVYPKEVECLIMPYSRFTVEKTTQRLQEMDEYEKPSMEEIRAKIDNHINTEETKTDTVAYAKLILESCKAKDRNDMYVYDPLKGRIEQAASFLNI
jgi:hypothetical protein